MKFRAHRFAATGFAIIACASFAADWKKAEPGWKYEFPRDHHLHRDFKTEWWYFTGNLFDDAGHRFGYELTFFRHGIRPATERDPNASRFIVDDLKFAHFAISDVAGQQFRFQQKTSRGAFGEAGFDDGKRLAWIDNWTLAKEDDGVMTLAAASNAETIRLRLRPVSGPVIHGENGVSVKAAGGSSASHYYSIPRLETTGELIINGVHRPVRGESWFDHEWATSQLGPDQVGWNWLSVQFNDGSELMLYQMRLRNGGVDSVSNGTFVAPDGTTTFLPSSAFAMTPLKRWKSKATGGDYPVEWRVEIPGRQLSIDVKPALENQELVLDKLTYWEGAIDIHGKGETREISGRGYLELTGYAPGSESPGRLRQSPSKKCRRIHEVQCVERSSFSFYHFCSSELFIGKRR